MCTFVALHHLFRTEGGERLVRSFICHYLWQFSIDISCSWQRIVLHFSTVMRNIVSVSLGFMQHFDKQTKWETEIESKRKKKPENKQTSSVHKYANAISSQRASEQMLFDEYKKKHTHTTNVETIAVLVFHLSCSFWLFAVWCIFNANVSLHILV